MVPPRADRVTALVADRDRILWAAGLADGMASRRACKYNCSR